MRGVARKRIDENSKLPQALSKVTLTHLYVWRFYLPAFRCLGPTASEHHLLLESFVSVDSRIKNVVSLVGRRRMSTRVVSVPII